MTLDEIDIAGMPAGLTVSSAHRPQLTFARRSEDAAAVLDSLGPVGRAIHSPDEAVVVDSLVERAKLSALLLAKLAAGEVVVRG